MHVVLVLFIAWLIAIVLAPIIPHGLIVQGILLITFSISVMVGHFKSLSRRDKQYES